MMKSKARVEIVNAGDYAPQLSRAELNASFRDVKREPWFRAVMQVVEGQRQLCQTAAESRANIGQHATFELGAAACCRDLLYLFAKLQEGCETDLGLAGHFR